MAELTPTTAGLEPPAEPESERVLRARIAKLEAMVEARTQTIVGLGARLAELQGDAPPAVAEQLRATAAELAELRSTKVIRYSSVPRRMYARVRRAIRG